MPLNKKIKKLKKDNREEGDGVKNRETEAIVFVPCTKGGKLQKELQEVEDNYIRGTNKKRIRVVECGGTKLKDILCQADPWASQKCEREGCFPCRGREDGKPTIGCMKESIMYTIKCITCLEGGVTAEY